MGISTSLHGLKSQMRQASAIRRRTAVKTCGSQAGACLGSYAPRASVGYKYRAIFTQTQRIHPHLSHTTYLSIYSTTSWFSRLPLFLLPCSYSRASTLPQPEEGALAARATSTSCTAGSYHSTATTCTVCPAGSSCDGTSGKAQLCNAGSYQPNKNSTSCIVTAAGYYTNQKGATQAIACSAGSYQPNKGSTSCIGTPAGYYTSKTGSAQAIACPAGSYQSNKNATSCTATTSGYYTNSSGSTAAIATTPGHYTNTTGATKSIPCEAGSYQPRSNETFCYGAPSGRFQGFEGQAVVCGTCCGWSAPLINNNVNPVNCTDPKKPNAGPASGTGCTADKMSCVHAKTCVQSSTGACPAGNFTG